MFVFLNHLHGQTGIKPGITPASMVSAISIILYFLLVFNKTLNIKNWCFPFGHRATEGMLMRTKVEEGL